MNYYWRLITIFSNGVPNSKPNYKFHQLIDLTSVVFSLFVGKLQRKKNLKMPDLKPKIEVHNDQSKKFECKFCQKVFSQKWILNSHSSFKHQKEDHKCDFCDEIFSFSNSFDLHVQKKHKGLQIFYCDICNKNFQYQKNFVKHLKTCKPITSKKCEACGILDKFFVNFFSI